jgi:hypothetical protein
MMVDSNQIDDGGLAFPGKRNQQVGMVSDYGFSDDDSPTFAEVEHPGMSLRDWFAGQALVGQLAFSPPDDPYNKFHEPEDVARMCYRFADAMLAARNGGAA